MYQPFDLSDYFLQYKNIERLTILVSIFECILMLKVVLLIHQIVLQRFVLCHYDEILTIEHFYKTDNINSRKPLLIYAYFLSVAVKVHKAYMIGFSSLFFIAWEITAPMQYNDEASYAKTISLVMS